MKPPVIQFVETKYKLHLRWYWKAKVDELCFRLGFIMQTTHCLCIVTFDCQSFLFSSEEALQYNMLALINNFNIKDPPFERLYCKTDCI